MPTPPRQLPRIAIVGRPNVGKSAIFNRLAGRRISIVHDEPGVTRDRIAVECRSGRLPYELTDTGGIGAALDDGFAEQIRAEADVAIGSADLILFVVDAREGVHPVDRELAAALRRADAPVVVLANKVDTPKTDADAAEFASLGFDRQLEISAAHGRHFDQLDALIQRELAGLKRDSPPPEDDAPGTPPVKIAVVGRPNVGKSSLVNAILEDERTIVSEIAGTTRDAVDVPYRRNDRDYTLIDTAGIRKRGRRDTSVEVFSSMRSEKSIRRADLCLLVIDASSGVVSQDRRIAKMVLDEAKPCIVLLNKFDLYHPDANFRDRIEQFREELGDDLFFLPYAPKVAISAHHRQHLGKIFTAIEERDRSGRPPHFHGRAEPPAAERHREQSPARPAATAAQAALRHPEARGSPPSRPGARVSPIREPGQPADANLRALPGEPDPGAVSHGGAALPLPRSLPQRHPREVGAEVTAPHFDRMSSTSSGEAGRTLILASSVIWTVGFSS